MTIAHIDGRRRVGQAHPTGLPGAMIRIRVRIRLAASSADASDVAHRIHPGRLVGVSGTRPAGGGNGGAAQSDQKREREPLIESFSFLSPVPFLAGLSPKCLVSATKSSNRTVSVMAALLSRGRDECVQARRRRGAAPGRIDA